MLTKARSTATAHGYERSSSLLVFYRTISTAGQIRQPREVTNIIKPRCDWIIRTHEITYANDGEVINRDTGSALFVHTFSINHDCC